MGQHITESPQNFENTETLCSIEESFQSSKDQLIKSLSDSISDGNINSIFNLEHTEETSNRELFNIAKLIIGIENNDAFQAVIDLYGIEAIDDIDTIIFDINQKLNINDLLVQKCIEFRDIFLLREEQGNSSREIDEECVRSLDNLFSDQI